MTIDLWKQRYDIQDPIRPIYYLPITKKLKNKIFDTLEQAQERIQKIVENLFEQEGKVSSLTCFPYLKNTT